MGSLQVESMSFHIDRIFAGDDEIYEAYNSYGLTKDLRVCRNKTAKSRSDKIVIPS